MQSYTFVGVVVKGLSLQTEGCRLQFQDCQRQHATIPAHSSGAELLAACWHLVNGFNEKEEFLAVGCSVTLSATLLMSGFRSTLVS